LGIGTIHLISDIVSFVFSITVLDQYFARIQTFQLLCAVGLFLNCKKLRKTLINEVISVYV
jgi:hypothetical protein